MVLDSSACLDLVLDTEPGRALHGLLLDLLTTSIGADADPDEVVAALVDRLVLRDVS